MQGGKEGARAIALYADLTLIEVEGSRVIPLRLPNVLQRFQTKGIQALLQAQGDMISDRSRPGPQGAFTVAFPGARLLLDGKTKKRPGVLIDAKPLCSGSRDGRAYSRWGTSSQLLSQLTLPAMTSHSSMLGPTGQTEFSS